MTRAPVTARADSHADGAVPAVPGLPSASAGQDTRGTRLHGAPLGWSRRGAPWADSRFWLLQLVVLALYLVRLAVLVAFHPAPTAPVAEFSTFVLFVAPVLAAALAYGLAGATVTSAWTTLLAVPRLALSLANRSYGPAAAEAVQVLLLVGIGLLVGRQVSAERTARRTADLRLLAHLDAQALYRDLFETNQSPIIIVDPEGRVVQANAAAQRAFGAPTGASGPTGAGGASGSLRVVDLIGAEAAGPVLTALLSARPATEGGGRRADTSGGPVVPITFSRHGITTVYRPTATVIGTTPATVIGTTPAASSLQVVFEDVTAETRRRELMEAFAIRVLQGQEEERRRIAHELHDGPVQALIHLCRQIDALGSEPAGPATPVALRATVEDTVAELRSIAKGLRPPILDDLGFVASVAQMVSEAGERFAFATGFGVTGVERRLSPTAELALFRIAQEALTNAARHAEARRVQVDVDFAEDGLRLRVVDDGLGFEPDGAISGSAASLGLPGMRERAQLIGADLDIRSASGSGTTLSVWLPTVPGET